MLKPYEYLLYRNKSQRQFIEKTFGCFRFVFTLALGVKTNTYKVSVSPFQLLIYVINLLNAQGNRHPGFKGMGKKIDNSFGNFICGKEGIAE